MLKSRKLCRVVCIIVTMCLLGGCSKNESKVPDAAVLPSETVDSPDVAPDITPAGVPTVILSAFSGDISENVTKTIIDDYAEFDSLPKSDQIKKQNTAQPVGQYTADFKTWNEFEEYFGVVVPNVLLECGIIDENSFSRGVHCLWRGKRDGSISWIAVTSRLKIEGMDVNYYLTVNMTKSDYEYEFSALNEKSYEVIKEPFEIFTYTEEGDTYFSNAVFARENILHSIGIFSSNDNEEKVNETFEYVLSRIAA